MSNYSLNRLINERTRLLNELATLSLLLHGSWVERFSTCSRPDCRCHAGQRHGPRYYLVINDKGNQRQKYIPNQYVKTAQKGLRQYKRLQEIVDRVTELNLQLFREEENAERR